MSIIEYFQINPLFFTLTCALFGAAVGSFLNVVIYRLPVMMERQWKAQCAEFNDAPADATTERFNLAVPRSRCPHCGHAISAAENIPVLSYLLLRGKCAKCKTPISIRYPIIETVSAILSAAVAWHFGVGWEAVAALALTWALITLTMIDFDHQLLPDIITLPFLWFGIALAMFGLFTDLQSSVIGAMFGYLSLWSIYWLFKLITGKEGMGYGDFKLLAALGAWLGWQSLPVIILMSSLVGAIIGVALMALRNHKRDIPIPFGPYLAIAGWIAMMWGNDISSAYLNFAKIS